jgi:hypothetical protein
MPHTNTRTTIDEWLLLQITRIPSWLRIFVSAIAYAVIGGVPIADRAGLIPPGIHWFWPWFTLFIGNFVVLRLVAGGTALSTEKSMGSIQNAVQSTVASLEDGTSAFPKAHLETLLWTMVGELRQLTKITPHEKIFAGILEPDEDNRSLLLKAVGGRAGWDHTTKPIHPNSHELYWRALNSGLSEVDPDVRGTKDYGGLRSIAVIPLIPTGSTRPVALIALGATYPGIFKKGKPLQRFEAHLGPYLHLILLALTIYSRRKNGRRKPPRG